MGCLYKNNAVECDADPNDCKFIYCKDGSCPVHTQEIADCNDSNICTDDSCDFGAKMCKNVPNTKPCDDASKCTNNDVCKDGKCSGTPIQKCDDNNKCTDDTCDPKTGCKYTPNNADCDDGNVCTQFDKCGSGKCQPGTKKCCDDGKKCKDDPCEPKSGCKHNPKIGPCNDGDECTFGEVCVGKVCKIADTVISTLSGSGSYGSDDGEASKAKFRKPVAVTVDDSGMVYVADEHRVRRVAKDGKVVTYAGSAKGYLDAPGTIAKFSNIGGLTWVSNNQLYISDSGNFRIRHVGSNASVTTFAGNGVKTIKDGTGTNASFSFPRGMVMTYDKKTMYLADGHAIRKITLATKVVKTFSGANTSGYQNGPTDIARFNNPWDVALDGKGNLYVSDWGNRRIRKVVNDVVYTLAGTGTSGTKDGPGAQAQFTTPGGLVVNYMGEAFVADPFTYRIRKILPNGVVSTPTGSVKGYQDGSASIAKFNLPTGLALMKGDTEIVLAEWKGLRIRKISLPLTNCDDKNPCTMESCDKAKGCQHTTIPGCK